VLDITVLATVRPMRFARWTFLIAGIYGLLVIAPEYFVERRYGQQYAPPINHPEFFYGFVGVTLAWQVLFLVIARDPVRLRPAMPVAVLEKASFAIAAPILYFVQHRIPPVMLAGGAIDAVLGIAFVIAYLKTPDLRISPTDAGV
jgi:hypothetical protein